jgi:hypothetical protein
MSHNAKKLPEIEIRLARVWLLKFRHSISPDEVGGSAEMPTGRYSPAANRYRRRVGEHLDMTDSRRRLVTYVDSIGGETKRYRIVLSFQRDRRGTEVVVELDARALHVIG